MQINLDENKIYDLSELTSEEWNILIPILKEKSEQKYDYQSLNYYKEDNNVISLCFNINSSWVVTSLEKPTTNAKELFYTLENIQVDCRELSEIEHKKVFEVFKSNEFITLDKVFETYNKTRERLTHISSNPLNQKGEDYLFGYYTLFEEKTTITYEKFMELFTEPKVNKSGWYKDGNFFMYHNFETDEKYGFCHDGFWANSTMRASDGYVDNCKLATKEEVEERLKQEAIKRGFVVGAEIGCLNSVDYFSEIEEDYYYLDGYCDEVFWNTFCVDSNVIMNDGVWLKSPYKEVLRGIETTEETTPLRLSEVIGGHINAQEKLGELLREEVSRQPTIEEVSSIFSARKEKENEKRNLKIKKTLKYLLKQDIILTPEQYKKLWKKS